MMRSLCAALAVFCVISSQAGAADLVTFQLRLAARRRSGTGLCRRPARLFRQREYRGEDPARPRRHGHVTKVATSVADMGEVGLDLFPGVESRVHDSGDGVMPFFTKVPDVLITVEGSGITSLKDVGGARGDVAVHLLQISTPGRWCFKNSGGRPNNVEVIKADPSTLGGMLASGQVDRSSIG